MNVPFVYSCIWEEIIEHLYCARFVLGSRDSKYVKSLLLWKLNLVSGQNKMTYKN